MDQSDFVGTGNWQFCAKWGLRALPDERTEAVGQLLEKEQTVEQICQASFKLPPENEPTP